MNRNILIVLGIILAGGLVWYGVTRDDAAPSPAPSENGSVTEEGSGMGRDAVDEHDEASDEAMEKDDASMEAGLEADASVMVAGEPDVTVAISGTNFAFSQEEIRVKEGQTVKVVFTSESGFHDWVVDEFDAATAQVRDGGVTEVTFVADKKGEYEYYCSVGKHREMGMVGTLIVE